MHASPFVTVVALLLFGARAEQTEQGEAALTDDTAQCAPYSIAVVANALSSFPTIGQPVLSIPANDTAALAKFKAITGIPNIQPKGTNGVLSNDTINNYPATDPDCWWTASGCLIPKVSGLTPDTASVPEPRTLGYGFDDGPFCSHNEFYNYLSSKNQKATMFYIGTNVMWFPLQAQRAAADGHEICVHTWSHRAMTALTNEAAFAELYYTIQAIKLVTGVTPQCWRPPMGDVDDRIRYIASKLNLQTILWKYDSFDWKVASNQATPTDVQGHYDSLITAVGAGTFDTVGAIMLTHELTNYTMQTAVDNYPKLAAAFDHIVPIAVAQNKTQPYVETNVTFPSFAAYTASRSSTGSNSTGAGSGSGSGSAKGPSPSSGSSQGISAGISLRLSYAGSSLIAALTLLGAALAL
ncbi:carbohydrate esterase family 4 protein [Mycena alexandri]|uniref:chitin deacetylase n=1 Tax=Mycena alexandri TaxID=1745969 RepID=A0AAD6XAD7_9AGAR|nr:carbohydrate esterase family 4 protein [Mycena alexandri]